MKLRLRSRSLLTTLCMVGLVVVSLSILLMWQFHQSTERIQDLSAESLTTQLVDQLRDYGTQMSSTLAADVASPLHALDMQSLREIQHTSLQHLNVRFIQAFDRPG